MKAVPRVRIPVLPPLNTCMRKAVLILGLLFWVATTNTVLAQEENKPTVPLVNLPVMLDCGPAEVIAEMLIEYEEVPVAQATVMWRIPSGEYLSGPMTIFAHPENKTVSFVIDISNGYACIAFPGKDFGPYLQGTKT